MRIRAYRVANDADHINRLGELGWELLYKQPIVVGRFFDMPRDASILDQWRDAFEYHANKSADDRRRLEADSFHFRKAWVNDGKERAYRLVDSRNSPLYKWRVEFSTTLDPDSDGDVLLGITFGKPHLNIPVFCSKDVVDKYVPAEWIAEALAEGCIEEYEFEEADTEPIGSTKPEAADA